MSHSKSHHVTSYPSILIMCHIKTYIAVGMSPKAAINSKLIWKNCEKLSFIVLGLKLNRLVAPRPQVFLLRPTDRGPQLPSRVGSRRTSPLTTANQARISTASA